MPNGPATSGTRSTSSGWPTTRSSGRDSDDQGRGKAAQQIGRPCLQGVKTSQGAPLLARQALDHQETLMLKFLAARRCTMAREDQSQNRVVSVIRPCRDNDRDPILPIIIFAPQAYRGVI